MMYLVVWVPFGLLLIALRVGGGKDFDYRPLLSFVAGLIVTGAGFVSMGVFFSSLTRNQIVSAVLTFSGMLSLTFIFLVEMYLQNSPRPADPNSTSMVVLKHMSYIDVWIDTLRGQLVPKFLVFPASMTVFYLFLSVKVLEARKWL
jgi:hypothetical protein